MFCQKICLSVVLILGLLSNNIIFAAGFAAGTLVRTESGYAHIEQLKEGDQVIGFNFSKAPACCGVSSITKGQSDKLIKITIDDEFFIVTPDQFFLTPQHTLIQGLKLNADDSIVGLSGAFVINNVEEIEGCAEVYTLSLEGKGMFFISKHNCAAFNFPNRIVRFTDGCTDKPAADVSVPWSIKPVVETIKKECTVEAVTNETKDCVKSWLIVRAAQEIIENAPKLAEIVVIIFREMTGQY